MDPEGFTASARCVVVGAGLTGATAAWRLGRSGFTVTVYERNVHVAGHVRNEWFRSLPYEPNGAHIFHTGDVEVWKLASSLVDFEPYVHEVKTRAAGHLLSWPIQQEEVTGLAEWPKIERELSERPDQPDASNFETWCISIMGATLYELFVAGYSRKQWGRDPSQLSAEFAPKRVELRTDGYRGLFRDAHQGWPRQGYAALVEALLEGSDVMLSTAVDIDTLRELVKPGVPVIVTSPLDDFFCSADGELEWRGVHLVPHFLPDTYFSQPAMVVNEPSADIPYTRTIESKWVLPDLREVRGTVVCYEYPGAVTKHYPVYDTEGTNRSRQHAYQVRLAAYGRNPLFAAGRLARYEYINMDEAMRQGLDVADKVLRSSRH